MDTGEIRKAESHVLAFPESARDVADSRGQPVRVETDEEARLLQMRDVIHIRRRVGEI